MVWLLGILQFLQQQKKKQEEELSALRKEVIGLQIMKSNYDQIVKANQTQAGQSENRVPDEIKFQLVVYFLYKWGNFQSLQYYFTLLFF